MKIKNLFLCFCCLIAFVFVVSCTDAQKNETEQELTETVQAAKKTNVEEVNGAIKVPQVVIPCWTGGVQLDVDCDGDLDIGNSYTAASQDDCLCKFHELYDRLIREGACFKFDSPICIQSECYEYPVGCFYSPQD